VKKACPIPPSRPAFPQQKGQEPAKEVNTMADQRPSRDPLVSLFREVVLVLGGVFAVRGTDDETVRRVARGLDRAWRRARGVPGEPTPKTLAPHPAIAELLRLTEDEGVTR